MAVSPFTAGLLSAGFSAATGLDIRSPFDITSPEGAAGPRTVHLGIRNLFGATTMTYSVADLESVRPLQMRVHMLDKNSTVSVPVDRHDLTADAFAEAAATRLGLPGNTPLSLYCNGSRVRRDEKIKNLGSGSVFCLQGGAPGDGEAILKLDVSDLDPKYDYDFRNKKDDGKVYDRSGFTYRRPYGWMRYAVKVLGEYEDDVWLGQDGVRTSSTPGEWPVSYHGTRHGNLKPIVEDGYHIGSGNRFGSAVYSSPSLHGVAEHYSKSFDYKGKKYKLVLQNRVNPDIKNGNLIIIPPEKTGFKDFPYWLSPNQDPEHGVYHVRPYGVLVREV